MKTHRLPIYKAIYRGEKTLPKTNIFATEKRPGPPKGNEYSDHPCSGTFAVGYSLVPATTNKHSIKENGDFETVVKKAFLMISINVTALKQVALTHPSPQTQNALYKYNIVLKNTPPFSSKVSRQSDTNYRFPKGHRKEHFSGVRCPSRIPRWTRRCCRGCSHIGPAQRWDRKQPKPPVIPCTDIPLKVG